MIITPDLMRACGSGADPTDLDCLKGYNFFMWQLEKYDPVNMRVPTLAKALELLKTAAKNGDVKREDSIFYTRFLLGLRTNPTAIRLGGSCTELHEYKWQDGVFKSLEAAEEERIKKINLVKSNPFFFINVLRHVRVGNGVVTTPVQSKEQLESKGDLTVFNETAGLHESANENLDEKILAAKEKIIRRLLHEKVHRKIRDEDEKFEAWEIINV